MAKEIGRLGGYGFRGTITAGDGLIAVAGITQTARQLTQIGKMPSALL